jgi:hypothetical protein
MMLRLALWWIGGLVVCGLVDCWIGGLVVTVDAIV